jgi:hypothetical protein
VWNRDGAEFTSPKIKLNEKERSRLISSILLQAKRAMQRGVTLTKSYCMIILPHFGATHRCQGPRV